MIRFGVVALGLLAGCPKSGDPYCEDLQQIASKPSSASDPLRLGYHFTSYALSISGLANGGVIVPMCSGLATLDATGKESKRIETDQAINVATGPGDTIYAVTRKPIDHTVTAASPDGTVRWQMPALDVDQVFGSVDGVYAEAFVFPTADNPDSQSSIVMYDAATGARRTVVPGNTAQNAVGAGPGGGVITEEEAATSVTLRQLDATGAAKWTSIATGTGPRVRGAAATPDGGVIVFGDAQSALDLGGLTIAKTSAGFVSFIAGLDAHGVAQWGYQLDTSVTAIAIAPNGDALLLGGNGVGLTVTRARSTGVVGQLTLPDRRSIDQLGIVPAGDGAVWLQVSLFDDEDSPDPVRLQIGDHTFTDTGYYLFQLGV